MSSFVQERNEPIEEELRMRSRHGAVRTRGTALAVSTALALVLVPLGARPAGATQWGKVTFQLAWTAGNPGNLFIPRGVAVNQANNVVYVLDTGNDRVQVFDPAGNWQSGWSTFGPGDADTFSNPTDLAVAPIGDVYVADTANHRLLRFTFDGTLLGSVAGLTDTAGVAVDDAGLVYVTDTTAPKVQVYSADLSTLLDSWGETGSDDGEFNTARGIDVDPAGNVYVTDTGGLERIQKFDADGTFLTKWGSAGTGDGQFDQPWDVAVDDGGHVFVTDAGIPSTANRVQKFDDDGTFLTEFGGPGSGDGQFNGIAAIDIDPLGRIFVADAFNHRIQRWSERGHYVPIAPQRILDTRFNVGLPGAFQAQQTRDLTVSPSGDGNGVPAEGVDAVVLNVTVTGAAAPGWLTTFPADAPLPNAANLNYVAGQTVPNLVVVKVGKTGGDNGKISIDNSTGNVAAGPVHVIADVAGYFQDGAFAPEDRFFGLTPTRILDTRFDVGLPGAFAPQATRNLAVAGVGGVPADADAVVINTAITGPQVAGFMTLFPADVTLPNAANLNFTAGLTVANLVTVKIAQSGPNDGQVSIKNSSSGTVHVIGDVVGYYRKGRSGASLNTMTPFRILDTRFGTGGVNGPVAPQATITVDPKTAPGLPPVGAYTGVVVNVAVTQTSAAGWLTAFPSDAMLPNAASLNFGAGTTVPNLVKLRVGPDGKFKINNTGGNPAAGTVQIVVDIVGWYQ